MNEQVYGVSFFCLRKMQFPLPAGDTGQVQDNSPTPESLCFQAVLIHDLENCTKLVYCTTWAWLS